MCLSTELATQKTRRSQYEDEQGNGDNKEHISTPGGQNNETSVVYIITTVP
jgi:hypothetical protein